MSRRSLAGVPLMRRPYSTLPATVSQANDVYSEKPSHGRTRGGDVPAVHQNLA